MKTPNIKIIKTFFIFIPLLFSSCITDPLDLDERDGTQYSATEPFHYALNSTGYSQLKIQGINGSIQVLGITHTDSILIQGEKKVESYSPDDAKEHLQDISIVLESIGNIQLVQTIQPSQSDGRNYLVHYTVWVPDSISIETLLVNGQTEVSDIKNRVRSNSTNGEINLQSIRGEMFSGITNGMVILNASEGNATISAVNGNIQAQLTLPDSGWCDLSTVNGSIGLSIPQTTSAIFRAGTVNGIVAVSNLTLTNSAFSQTLVTGILGAGRGSINLEAVNGNISASGY